MLQILNLTNQKLTYRTVVFEEVLGAVTTAIGGIALAILRASAAVLAVETVGIVRARNFTTRAVPARSANAPTYICNILRNIR